MELRTKNPSIDNRRVHMNEIHDIVDTVSDNTS